MREAFEESAFRMVTDQQIRRLFKLSNTEKTQAIAASKAGMDVKTARKYLRARRSPSERKRSVTGGRGRMVFPQCGRRFRSSCGPTPGWR
jgi:hypothetical protein